MPSRCFINIIAFIVVTLFFSDYFSSNIKIYMEQKFSCEKIIIFSVCRVDGKCLKNTKKKFLLLLLLILQLTLLTPYIYFSDIFFGLLVFDIDVCSLSNTFDLIITRLFLAIIYDTTKLWLMQEMHVKSNEIFLVHFSFLRAVQDDRPQSNSIHSSIQVSL